MDPPPPSTTTTSPAQQQQQAGVPPSGPQVRSRITVVCAECKRLKLKCDRKTPCGSCEKRDTVARCIYSPAAAEKVDLHSLNNRLSVVEAQLAQMGSAGTRPYSHSGASGSGLPLNDRALIAVGHSGSSLTIPLEDVTAIWLDQLDLTKDPHPTDNQHNSSLSPTIAPHTPSQIKLEPNTVHLHRTNMASELPAALLTPPPSIYFSVKPRSSQPSVSPELVNILPSSPSKRRKLCNNVEEILTINPCFNWKHFRERMDSMFRWAANAEAIDRAAMESRSSSPRSASRADVARAIYFGDPMPSAPKASEPKPTVSFFAAVACALALGAQVNRDNGANEDNAMIVDDILSNGRPPSRKAHSCASSGHGKKSKTTVNTSSQPSNMDSKLNVSPTMLYALSEQALDIFEKSGTYDLDFLIALIMQALYMLHDGKAVLDHRLYPLVGRMVNVARMMGLSMDPDEFPGRYSLFEAETRRRIWWDIYCYDLYVSDSMGHPPMIPDNSYTTKIPVDVDENSFSPSSTTIPVASADDHVGKYFGLKLRMAQIVKGVKKRTFKDPLTDSPLSESAMIEEAAAFESEVTHFLLDLPPAFKLDIDLSALSAAPSSPSLYSAASPGHSSSSASLIAQQCGLVITGQRLILKIYLPFLRPNHSGSTCNATHNQASIGTINAAHAIIFASRVLHALCKQPPGAKSKRPGPAIFDYYSFGQALFDAAVVCAHSVITQPTAIWANVALEDVVGALEVMKDPVVATGRCSLQPGAEGSVSEPVKVIEMLKKKADNARAGHATLSGSNLGSKRKHAEFETDAGHLLPGFQLPYVGAAVASAGPAASPGSSASASSPPDGTYSDSVVPGNGSEGGGTRRSDSSKTKSRKDKKSPYPMVGIRVRHGKEGPSLPRRERADSTASATSLVETDARMQAPGPFTSSQSTSQVSTPVLANHHSFSTPAAQEPSSMYQPPPSAEPMQPPMQSELTPTSHTDYSTPFIHPENSNMHMNAPPKHKFPIHDVGSQQRYSTGTPNPISMFDQSQNIPFTSTSSPVSFRPSSSGHSSSGSLSFSGGPRISSPLSTPFAPSHDTNTQSYKPSPPSNYFTPQPYHSFDNSSQGPSLGLNLTSTMSMDNTGNMNGSLVTSSSDLMFDPKARDNNGLQQSFGNVQAQGQGWQQNNSGNGQYWQSQYKPYYPP